MDRMAIFAKTARGKIQKADTNTFVYYLNISSCFMCFGFILSL